MKGLRSKVLNDVFASPKKKKNLMAGHVNYVCAVVESMIPVFGLKLRWNGK